MARRVYFAFHFQKDIFRVNVVRKSSFLQEEVGFYDGSLWEEAEEKGVEALQKLIKDGLTGTTVTAFLLGEETSTRPWVRYELEQSYQRGNGLLAIHINGIKDTRTGTVGLKGANIFDVYSFPKDHLRAGQSLSTFYKTYDWVANSGYQNFGAWVEAAAKAVGK